jgi:hypothetical protein
MPFIFIDDSSSFVTPPPPPAELVIDSFNRSGLLNGSTPDTVNTPGNNWVAAPDWTTLGGEAITAGSAIAFLNIEQSDCEIEAEFKGSAGNFFGIVAKVNNDNAFGANSYYYMGGYFGGGWEMGFYDNSNYPWYTDGGATIPSDTYFTGKAIVSGDTLTLFINGIQANTTTQTYGTGIRVGILGDLLTNNFYCRRFTVKPL